MGDNERALATERELVFDRLQVILTELRKQVNSGQRNHVSLTSFRFFPTKRDLCCSGAHFGGHIFSETENRGCTERSRLTPNSKLGYIENPMDSELRKQQNVDSTDVAGG